MGESTTGGNDNGSQASERRSTTTSSSSGTTSAAFSGGLTEDQNVGLGCGVGVPGAVLMLAIVARLWPMRLK